MDEDGNGCVRLSEMGSWMQSHSLSDPNEVLSRLAGETFEMDSLSALTISKIMKEGILAGQC